MKKYLFSLVSGLSFALMTFLPVSVKALGTAQFSLSPSGGSHAQNSTFSVSVFENGSNVSAVTANLTYSANLECTGVSGGSAFPSQISGSCGSGSIAISRYIAPGTLGVSGNTAVATIGFKVSSAASGTASVSFAGGSQIASNGVDVWNGDTGSNGANFAVIAPVPAATVVTPPIKKVTTTAPKPKPSVITPTSNTVEAATTDPVPTTPTITAPIKNSKPIVATTTVSPKRKTRTALKWAGFTTIAIGGSMFYQRANKTKSKAKPKPTTSKKK